MATVNTGEFLHTHTSLNNLLLACGGGIGKGLSSLYLWNKKIRKIQLSQSASELLSDIKDSNLIFMGHLPDEDNPHYFLGKDGRYTGKPDYIFKNKKTSKYFVVEEKFSCIGNENHRTHKDFKHFEKGYPNQLNQLKSYIYGIQEFNIEYGYLALIGYRNIIRDSSGRRIYNTIGLRKIHAEKICKSNSSNRNEIIRVYKNMRNTIKAGVASFDVSGRSARKCARCSVNLLCGHKTGKFQKFQFPYSENHLI